MFNNPGTDGLHPNAQGDLIIAGNLAKAMGYAGRTAGQERKDAASFSIREASAQLEDGSFSLSWEEGADLDNGFTADISSLVFGNGAEDGWGTDDIVSISLGNGSLSGTLSVSESGFLWNGVMLYSLDMSENADSLRISYITGNEAEGVAAGYYVWLDDMLIGEGLSATEGSSLSGLEISYSGNSSLTLGDVAIEIGSWAPTTTGLAGSNLYLMSDPNVSTSAPPEGKGDWTGAAEAVVSDKTVYADMTGGQGDFVCRTSQSAENWYGAHSGSSLTGSASLLVENVVGSVGAVFGSVNGNTVSGDITVEIDSENAVFGTFTKTDKLMVSVIGAYKSSITGTMKTVLDAGTFSYAVMGGIFKDGGDDHSIGKVELYVNGGVLNGGLHGGGHAGTIGSGDGGTAVGVTVTGGTIYGGVYGGGIGGFSYGEGEGIEVSGDTIKGNVEVNVKGGVIIGGIYGGGTAGVIEGGTAVTIDGNVAQLRESSNTAWSEINGGGTGGTVKGDSVVTIKNLSVGNNANGMDKFAGVISGGDNVEGVKTLVLSNVNAPKFDPTLASFDVVQVKDGSSLTLQGLGGATRLEVTGGSTLALNSASVVSAYALAAEGLDDGIAALADGATGLTEIALAADSSLSLYYSDLASEVYIYVDSLEAGSSLVIVDGKDQDLSGLHFMLGDEELQFDAWVADAQANPLGITFKLSMVPEPATATLSLLALAALAARRRRATARN